MSFKKENNHGWFWSLLFLVWGIGFGLFMSRKPGKELRQEIYTRWDKGESLPKAKWSVFAREFVAAFRSFPEVIEEFFATDKASEMKEKGIKLMDQGKKYVNEGKNFMHDSKKYVDEGKKFMDKEIKVVTNKAKEMAKEVVKDIKKKMS